MKNNPLIDALAILMCLIAVIALGHYFESKKKNKLQQTEKRVELKADKKQTFESLVKITE